MICAVDHINIVVFDLERSLGFYTKVLGFKETHRAYPVSYTHLTLPTKA